MEFIKPELEEIYQQVTNNNRLVEALLEDKLLLNIEYLYEIFEPRDVKKNTSLILAENINVMRNLSQLLYDNSSYIEKTSIDLLIENKFLFSDISFIFGNMIPSERTYREIFYCYKYSSVKSFFQNNKKSFIPEYDLFQIEEYDVSQALVDAILKEFDKIDFVLNKTFQYNSLDKIPIQYINYLTQLLGLEKTLIYEENDYKYREIAKNIIDIFRMKGTNYSFEVFFGFLGFNIEIKEFYFDRRLFYGTNEFNDETEVGDKKRAEFYLTTSNPIFNELQNLTINEMVHFEDISSQFSLNEFDDLVKTYGLEAVLGYNEYYSLNGRLVKYEEKVYKYFKTNKIYYNVSLDDRNPSASDTRSITKYISLLTPAFVMNVLNIKVYDAAAEENIWFDNDGSGMYQATDFVMLDSEDWYRYNNDERSVGKLSLSNKEDYWEGERIPLRLSWKEINLSKYVGRDGRPKIKNLRLKYITTDGVMKEEEFDSIYNLTPTKSIFPVLADWPPSTNLLQPWNTKMEWLDIDKFGATKEDYMGSPKSLKEMVKRNNFYHQIQYYTELPIEDFIAQNLDDINALKIVKGYNRVWRAERNFVSKEDARKEYYISYEFDDMASANSYLNTIDEEISNHIFQRCFVLIGTNVFFLGSYHESFEYVLAETQAGYLDGYNVSLIQGAVILNDMNSALRYLSENKNKTIDGIPVLKAGDIFFISAESKYYLAVKKNPITNFISTNQYVFLTIEDAINYFNANPSKKYNEVEFYLTGNLKQEDNCLYRFVWKNKIPGKTDFYSYADDKYYRLEKTLSLTQDDSSYVKIVKNIEPEGIVEKELFIERKSGLVERNFFGNLKIEDGVARIYEYDPFYKNYSEQADEEDFLFYNHSHSVTWMNSTSFMRRPVFQQIKDKYSYQIGVELVKNICNKTVQFFEGDEYFGEELIGNDPAGLLYTIEQFIENDPDTKINIYSNVTGFLVDYYLYITEGLQIPAANLKDEDLERANLVLPIFNSTNYIDCLNQMIVLVNRFIDSRVLDTSTNVSNSTSPLIMKNSYGELLNFYQPFLELLNILAGNKEDAENYFISMTYEELLKRYREENFDDSSFFYSADDVYQMSIRPDLKVSFGDNMGKYDYQVMFNNSKDNNGGIGDGYVKLRVKTISARNDEITFYVEEGDFISRVGTKYDPNFIEESIRNIAKNNPELSQGEIAYLEEYTRQVLENLYREMVREIYPNLYNFDFNQISYVAGYTGTKPYQKLKPFLHREIAGVEISRATNEGKNYYLLTSKIEEFSAISFPQINPDFRNEEVGFLKLHYLNNYWNENVGSIPSLKYHPWLRKIGLVPDEFAYQGLDNNFTIEGYNHAIDENYTGANSFSVFSNGENLTQSVKDYYEEISLGANNEQIITTKNLPVANYFEVTLVYDIWKFQMSSQNFMELNIQNFPSLFIFTAFAAKDNYKEVFSFSNFRMNKILFLLSNIWSENFTIPNPFSSKLAETILTISSQYFQQETIGNDAIAKIGKILTHLNLKETKSIFSSIMEVGALMISHGILKEIFSAGLESLSKRIQTILEEQSYYFQKNTLFDIEQITKRIETILENQSSWKETKSLVAPSISKKIQTILEEQGYYEEIMELISASFDGILKETNLEISAFLQETISTGMEEIVSFIGETYLRNVTNLLQEGELLESLISAICVIVWPDSYFQQINISSLQELVRETILETQYLWQTISLDYDLLLEPTGCMVAEKNFSQYYSLIVKKENEDGELEDEIEEMEVEGHLHSWNKSFDGYIILPNPTTEFGGLLHGHRDGNLDQIYEIEESLGVQQDLQNQKALKEEATFSQTEKFISGFVDLETESLKQESRIEREEDFWYINGEFNPVFSIEDNNLKEEFDEENPAPPLFYLDEQGKMFVNSDREFYINGGNLYLDDEIGDN
jgi:hypothetical protein